MSTLATNAITDASGGNTATINSYTPTESNMAGRNRIINGDMRIDQRNAGASVTITTGGLVYCVDRFYNFALGANATAQRVSSGVSGFPFAVRITGASGNTYFETGQRIESANCAGLVGKQVTVSFTVASSSLSTISCTLVRASGGVDNFGSATEIQTISQPITSTLTQYSVTFNALPSTAADGIAIGFIASSGLAASETITITGVQLEAGSVATPFEHRQYGQELALCQRYFELIGAGVGRAVSSTDAQLNCSFMVEKRATPTVALVNGTGVLLEVGVAIRNVTLDAAAPNTKGSYLDMASTGLTSPNMLMLYNAPNIISASAEL